MKEWLRLHIATEQTKRGRTGEGPDRTHPGRPAAGGAAVHTMAPSLALAAVLLAAGRADEPSYYVSSSCGSDSNDGQTPSSAWQSLRRANQTTLPPGTQLLLRRGDVWIETLQLSVRGERGRPVRISAYGDISLARPLIRRENKTTDIAMLLDDASFVEIDGLSFSTAKIGLYLRYWETYGHESVSVANCTFDQIDDPVGLAAAFSLVMYSLPPISPLMLRAGI